MLTNNYASLLSLSIGTKSDNLPVCKDTNGGTVSPNKTWFATILQYSLTTITGDGKTQRGHWMVFGGGSTAVKSSDISIESPITEGFDVISQTSNIPYIYSSTAMTVTRIIQNTGSAPITISEVGLYGANSQTTAIMLAHEVIEPVTLQPGEKHSFTIDLCVE